VSIRGRVVRRPGMEATLPPVTPRHRAVDKKLWTARILSSLALLFLLFDAIAKLLRLAPVMEASVRIGYRAETIVPLGVVLLACTLFYAVPRTAVLGAILLTGWLGGAVATHVRMGEPFWMPVLFGIILWGCLFLRDDRLRALLPLVRPRNDRAR
jgi:hypothetical protein